MRTGPTAMAGGEEDATNHAHGEEDAGYSDEAFEHLRTQGAGSENPTGRSPHAIAQLPTACGPAVRRSAPYPPPRSSCSPLRSTEPSGLPSMLRFPAR